MSLKREQLTAGEALLAAGLGKEALPYLLTAHENDPENWRHTSNLAAAYRICGHLELAKEKLLEAMDINGTSPEIWNNLSNVLADLGDFDNSERAALNSFKLSCTRHSAMTYGASLLRQGDWENGGRLYNSGRIGFSWVPIQGIPVWEGQEIKGKSLLVLPEGGYGDSFFAVPFMKEVVRRGGDVTYLVWEEQIETLKMCDFPIKLLSRDKHFDGRPYHYQCPTLSLLFALGWKKEEVVPCRRIIDVTEELRREASRKLSNAGKRNFGICWYAEENTTARKFRSMSTEEISPLQAVDCHWVNLTLEKQVPEWIETKPTSSWEETAALISQLDLVVTVDTAVAHLAGCLGKKTLIVVPLNVDWKWGKEGESSTWYESASLLRNSDPLSFKPAVENLLGLLH